VQLPFKTEQGHHQRPVHAEGYRPTSQEGQRVITYEERQNTGYSPPPEVRSSHPQAPLIIPQQTVVMSRPQEPKGQQSTVYYSEYNRPPQVEFSRPPVEFSRPPGPAYTSVRFNAGETVVLPPENRATHYERTEVRPQSVPMGTHEQIFYRYANLNHEPLSNGVTYAPPLRAPTLPLNTLNAQTTFTSSPRPWQQPPSAVITSQFAPRPQSSFQASTQVITSTMQASTGDGSSDFLKKIDQQLEASRKQFPSS
jgi:hypothetical protein